jgi:hypothetical protein
MLACGFNYVQSCSSIMTAVASGCDPVVSLTTGRRLGSPPHEQQPRTSHHRTDAGPCTTLWQYFGFAPAMFLNSHTSLSMYIFYNSRIHVITLYSGHVCIVLCVNTLVLAPHMDLG